MAPRVGFDITPALVDHAGVSRYSLELMRALRRSVPLEVLSASDRRPATELNRIAAGLRRELYYYPFGLARRAGRLGVDLVHCPGPYSPRVTAVPLVVTVYDLLPFRYPELFTRRVVAHMRSLGASAARRATHITTISQHSRSEIEELLGVPAERITVAYPGVGGAFRPTAPDPQRLRERFGIDGPFVLSVGTLEPRKNLVTVLDAFESLSADCTLVVAGASGWRNEEFDRRLERARGRIVVTGRVSDDELVALYGAAACFAYPSLYEGFGIPPLEAMACGTPVIVSDSTSLPEVVGDAGLLVPARDADALAAEIDRILLSPDLAADLGARGIARSKQFTWDRCAESTVSAYRHALA